MISAEALTLSEAAALVARATIVLSLTWLGARIATRRSASTRHAVWAAGFIAALALPFAARAVPRWSLAVLPTAVLERAAPAAEGIVTPPSAGHALPGIDVRAPHSANRHPTPTIDPTGSLAESLKPPELPKFSDTGLQAAPALEAQPQPAAEMTGTEAAQPAVPAIAPPHDASQDTVPLKQ